MAPSGTIHAIDVDFSRPKTDGKGSLLSRAEPSIQQIQNWSRFTIHKEHGLIHANMAPSGTTGHPIIARETIFSADPELESAHNSQGTWLNPCY
jgi:hypothetical protein